MKLPAKRAREGPPGPGSPAQQPQSEEVLRLRARRRLIGAVALVLTGVVVFPLIFETQPKPISSNISLVIPPQGAASSVAAPVAPSAGGSGAAAAAPTTGSHPAAQSAPVAPAPQAAPRPAPVAHSAPAQAARPLPAAPRPATQQAAAAPAQPRQQPHAQPQPQPQPPAKLAAARQALAALEDKPASQISLAQAARAAQSPATTRYVVQAGAYADAASARAVGRRIDAAGLRSYTQVIDTRAGKRVRVRVGPFASRDQAEQALRRIQALGIHAAVLTL